MIGRGLWIRLRRTYRKVMTAHGTPAAVARGFAVGTFFAFTPTGGVQMLLAGVFAALVNGSVAAAVIATWITNPLTVIPAALSSYWVGRVILGMPSLQGWDRIRQLVTVEDVGFWDLVRNKAHEVAALGWDVLGPYLLGCAVIGLVAAVISYPLVVRLVRWKKKLRHAQRVTKWGLRPEGSTPPPARSPGPPAETKKTNES